MKITVKDTKLETGLRPNSAGIPSTLLSRGLRPLAFQLLGFYCNGFKGSSVVGSGDSVWDPKQNCKGGRAGLYVFLKFQGLGHAAGL